MLPHFLDCKYPPILNTLPHFSEKNIPRKLTFQCRYGSDQSNAPYFEHHRIEKREFKKVQLVWERNKVCMHTARNSWTGQPRSGNMLETAATACLLKSTTGLRKKPLQVTAPLFKHCSGLGCANRLRRATVSCCWTPVVCGFHSSSKPQCLDSCKMPQFQHTNISTNIMLS